VTILATDISTRMLRIAMRGVYSGKSLEGCDPGVVAKYFVRDGGDDEASYRVIPELRSMVRFSHLNLVDRWPVGPSFDVVFFRNVMIYMDKPTQKELCRRFFWAIKPGGYFFVGHAESLIGLGVELEKVRPSIYRKAPDRGL
jgi:chemotaxis protein methyltransferase CheR